MRIAPFVMLAAAAIAACAGGGAAGPTAATVEVTPQAAAPASVAPATEVPDAATTPTAIDDGDAGEMGEAATSAQATSVSVSADAARGDASIMCGDAPLPDCPLQSWMKANMAPAYQSRDWNLLSSRFYRVASVMPQDYTTWQQIAYDGAMAASSQDFDGVKRACKACHSTYQARYRREMRDHPF
jgi:hypothetical protein